MVYWSINKRVETLLARRGMSQRRIRAASDRAAAPERPATQHPSALPAFDPDALAYLAGLRFAYAACGRQDKLDELERNVAELNQLGLRHRIAIKCRDNG